MTSELTEGPAILIGYQYDLVLEAEAPIFTADATITGHVRASRSSDAILATLVSGSGILRKSDTQIQITIAPEDTAAMTVGTVVMDFARTDLTPPKHLRFQVEVPVQMPVTRGA